MIRATDAEEKVGKGWESVLERAVGGGSCPAQGKHMQWPKNMERITGLSSDSDEMLGKAVKNTVVLTMFEEFWFHIYLLHFPLYLRGLKAGKPGRQCSSPFSYT